METPDPKAIQTLDLGTAQQEVRDYIRPTAKNITNMTENLLLLIQEARPADSEKYKQSIYAIEKQVCIMEQELENVRKILHLQKKSQKRGRAGN
jgi:hypothetical protein